MAQIFPEPTTPDELRNTLGQFDDQYKTADYDINRSNINVGSALPALTAATNALNSALKGCNNQLNKLSGEEKERFKTEFGQRLEDAQKNLKFLQGQYDRLKEKYGPDKMRPPQISPPNERAEARNASVTTLNERPSEGAAIKPAAEVAVRLGAQPAPNQVKSGIRYSLITP